MGLKWKAEFFNLFLMRVKLKSGVICFRAASQEFQKQQATAIGEHINIYRKGKEATTLVRGSKVSGIASILCLQLSRFHS